jgi:chemotaxis protein CheX
MNATVAMPEDDLKVFVKGTEHFFHHITALPAEVSTPFIKEHGDRVILDFSAVIGISGSQRGCVYYTATREMIVDLLPHFGETDNNDDLLADCVGEIANTISGNAREYLGPNFMISVPVVFCGRPDDVRFPQEAPCFVLPIDWNGHRSSLILCLKRDDDLSADFNEAALKELT